MSVVDGLPMFLGDSDPRRSLMKGPEDVAIMLRLHALGWGVRRIAHELHTSRNTVREYLRRGGWRAYQRSSRKRKLDGLGAWLTSEFRKHRGNADVVRQELEKVFGIRVSLRTVERAVAGFRQELRAEAVATVRFETPPGKQLQIDFGERRVSIAGQSEKVFLFVATLGYSRRIFVRAFSHERQSAWFEGIDGAFRHFEGTPEELLLDNARALVLTHDPVARTVVFSDRFIEFCRYWRVHPHACAPYRAQTKGKDESGVGYVKKNAIAGHSFHSWDHLESHLMWWAKNIADVRVHGTTGDLPIDRFVSHESNALKPLSGKPPFLQTRELRRRVQNDSCVEIDTNHYSVPWRLIGREVRVVVGDGKLNVLSENHRVATHAQTHGRGEWVVEREHLAGVIRLPAPKKASAVSEPSPKSPELLRPLSEYEAVIGGEA